MRDKPVLWLVIPCFKEDTVLPITAPLFLKKVLQLEENKKISKDSKILFVNDYVRDGSTDKTWEMICNLAKEDNHFRGIRQSANRGQQNAVLAGLMEAKDCCDITITIDCDGQDDLEAVDRMIDAYCDGCEVVYGVRSSRMTDSWFYRNCAQMYYRILKWLGADIIFNHSDYRLVSSKVLQHFADFGEVDVFTRGLFPLIGFKSAEVYYERQSRIAGKTQYPLKRAIGVALNGITSLTIRPMTLIIELGLVVGFLGFVGLIWSIVLAARGGISLEWVILLCAGGFLWGSLVAIVGFVGLYVGKTYMEAKHRPRYIISERTYENTIDRDIED